MAIRIHRTLDPGQQHPSVRRRAAAVAGLTLVLSLQAAYAAPLILLAQNRQESRDRMTTDNDRKTAERTQADTEFLAREIASVRLALADVPTSSDLEDQLDRLTTAIERMTARLDELEVQSQKEP
ncbi:MAG: DUF1003 domain-containing protein [Acidimicrobiaceae bacterium]|nr:DUF1003 domain-containing protein [Acidimicrobiaceae bacterium]